MESVKQHGPSASRPRGGVSLAASRQNSDSLTVSDFLCSGEQERIGGNGTKVGAICQAEGAPLAGQSALTGAAARKWAPFD
jgi:hypothetical protein